MSLSTADCKGRYSVAPGALVITQGSGVLSNEPMVEYWSG